MSTLGAPYKTGTVSTDTGGSPDLKKIIGTGTMWSPVVEQGDIFYAAGDYGVIETVDDDTHIHLYENWAGSSLTGANYLILKSSWLRYDPSLTQAKVRQLIAMLEGASILYLVTGSVPDPGIGEDGQFAIKTNAGAWKQWQKQTGVWVDIGTPVGTTWKGTWNSGTAYNVNDLVERLGSTYVSKTSNTNKPPESNGSDWGIASAKGNPGNDGGAIVIPYTFSNSTVDSDPGNGTIRLNQGTERTSTTIRADLLDSNGRDWSGVFTNLAAGSSASKFKVRMYKASDQTAFLIFDATAVASPSGYKNITVSNVAYSADSPFSNGDAVVLALTPTGDMGSQGNPGTNGTNGTNGAKGAQWRGAWNNATAYSIDDWTSYGGKVYISIQAGTNQQPDTATAYWTLYFDPSAPAKEIVVVDKSSSYTALPTDRGTMLRFTASATLALTAAATLGNGWFCYVKGDGGSVTLDPDSSEQIDAQLTVSIANGSAALVICNGSAFITFQTSSGGGSLGNIAESVKTADYSILSADLGKKIVSDSASAVTFTLPSVATAGANFVIWTRNINTGTLTIDGNGSETIDGDLTFVLDKDEEALLVCNGTAWRKDVFRSEGHLEPETDVASASTADIGSTNTERVRITGSTTITSFGSRARKRRELRFTGALILTHNASTLILPTGLNINTANGDTAVAESDSSGNWRVTDYRRADGTPLAVTSLIPFGAPPNIQINVSASSNNLTIAIKGNDGNDATPARPINVPFRDTTLTNGGVIWRSITGALSFTINSGNTMGTVTNQPFRLWLVAIDNGGTVLLGAIRCLIGSTAPTQVVRLNTDILWATGSGTNGGSSAGVLYTSVASLSSKAIRVLGYIESTSTSFTAGSWGTSGVGLITKAQLYGPDVILPGGYASDIWMFDSAQRSISSTSYQSLSFSASITPVSACNVIQAKATFTSEYDPGVGGVSANLVLGRSSGSPVGTVAALYANGTNLANSQVVGGMEAPFSASSLTYTLYGKFSGGTGTLYANSVSIELREIVT